jgi:methylglutaconyl-CoA hydratase
MRRLCVVEAAGLLKGGVRRRSLSAIASPKKDVILSFESDGTAYIKLNRPDVHNAFNDKVVAQIRDCVGEVERKREQVRVLFLVSEGKSFSAGGDLNYMKEMAQASKDRNKQDALALSQMLNALAVVPVPTVALVQGPAFGGGVGLVSVCDMAVGIKSATFALSEVKLGLLPATISPYVVQRIGAAQARRYFLTAERFDALTAQRIGLLHEVVDSAAQLEEWRIKLRDVFKQNSPTGVAASKALIRAVSGKPVSNELMLDTAERLAEQRASAQGVEGVTAFLEKRPPKWAL